MKNDDGHADTGDEVAEGRRRFPRLKPRASETEDRLAERFAQQWALLRAERRPSR